MRFDKTEIALLGVGVALAISGLLAPGWLIFLLTVALAKGLVVQGVVMQMRAGMVSFGQGLFYCVGGYAVGMGGQFLGVSSAVLLLVLGVAAAAVLAMVLGLLLTRYREIFFAMLSLAFSMILYGVLVKGQALGGQQSDDDHFLPDAGLCGGGGVLPAPLHPLGRGGGVRSNA